MLRLRGSERVVRKPDQFESRLHQIESYQNLSEDRETLVPIKWYLETCLPSGSSFRLCPIVQKIALKKFRYPSTLLAFAFSFQIRFVEFVSVVESCCWY